MKTKLIEILISAATLTACAADIFVSADGQWNPTGEGAVFTTLKAAVAAAKAGDTITLADGFIEEPSDEKDWDGSETAACGKWHFLVNKPIVIRGVSDDARGNSNAPRIRGRFHDAGNGVKAGRNAIRAMNVNAGKFMGLVIEESSAFATASYPGGAIYGGGKAEFSKCVIRNNNSCRGAVCGSGLVFRDCVFSNNVGGAIYGCSAYNTLFVNNKGGAAFYNGDRGKDKPIVISGCTFDSNETSGSGAAICGGLNSYNNYWIISDSYFTNNISGYFGGAIYAWGEVSNCTFVANVMKGRCENRKTGGAVIPKDPDDFPLFITNCTFTANKALGNLGGAPTRINRTPRLDCTTDKEPVLYKCGETAVVTFSTPYTNDLEVTWKMHRDYDDMIVNGTGSVVKVTMDRPGFVWIEAKAANGRWPFTYDASVGFDIDKIRVTTPRPADFEKFWADRKAEVASIDMNPRVEEVKSPTPGVKLFKVHLDAPGMGKLASGWLSIPEPKKHGKKFPAEATFFGYGNSWGAHHHKPPTSCPNDRIEFLVNAHAYELMREKEHYDEVYKAAQSNGHTHGLDPVQNAKPETCYFLGMVLRDLAAIRYLKTRPEWNGKDLTVTGHSQGGLQSVWMSALADGVTKLRAEAPWNCNMAGWTEGRIRPTRLPIENADGLAYFDPCHMTTLFPKNLDAEIIRAGLGDYCCPPSGIAAFYNSILCPKKISWAQGSHHSDLPIDVRWTVIKDPE